MTLRRTELRIPLMLHKDRKVLAALAERPRRGGRARPKASMRAVVMQPIAGSQVGVTPVGPQADPPLRVNVAASSSPAPFFPPAAEQPADMKTGAQRPPCHWKCGHLFVTGRPRTESWSDTLSSVGCSPGPSKLGASPHCDGSKTKAPNVTAKPPAS
jgi:hypothetical protein